MGFHVYPKALTLSGNVADREKSEMKFYINAGIDTYKVARIFQEKCKENNLNYYFKVANANKGEHCRADKMCIYTSFKNAEKFLDIIREIKIENPDIIFDKPPIFTGRIDDFIGVGTDHIGGGSSYNSIMSKICLESMEKVFNGIKREDIMEHIKMHPEKLQELENEIIGKAKEFGLSEEKLCVEKNFCEKINSFKKNEKNKGDSKGYKGSENNDLDKEKENVSTAKKNEKLLSNEMREKVNEFKSCICEMIESHENKNYKEYISKTKQYNALIRDICDIKIKESGNNITPVERMIEYRKLDFIGSAILDSAIRIFEKIKYNNKEVSDSDIEVIESSIDSLEEYLISEIKPIRTTEKSNSTKIDASSLNKNAKKEEFKSNQYSGKEEDR